MAWYNASWSYRVKVTVLNAKVDADLTDFPVYVNLANLPAGFHSHVNQTDGRDIRVTSSDGTTELPREVVFYDSTGDAGELHFKAASLANATDADFYIYYGNTSATEPAANATFGSQNVWTNSYVAIYHLPNGSSLTVNDSTSGAKNLTNNNSTTATAGQVDGGANFNGSTQSLTSSFLASTMGSTYTIQLWAYTTTVATLQTVLAFTAGADFSGWALINVSGILWRWQKDEGTFPLINSTTSRSNNTWYMYTIASSGASAGNTKLYTNGANQDDGAAVPAPTGTYAMVLGRQLPGTPSRYWAGKIDEVRISSVTRTATWISTEYNNQSSPDTFYSVSTEESQGISPSASTSPSGSASLSQSPSSSISPSASISPSSSDSASQSPSSSISPSASESVSTSPSASESVSQSPSASISPSASVSLSQSPSGSVSLSPSPSASISPSASQSPSASTSLSVSPSPSPEFNNNAPLYFKVAKELSIMLGRQRMAYWNTLGRPATPNRGTVGYNTDLNQIEFYTGVGWKKIVLTDI